MRKAPPRQEDNGGLPEKPKPIGDFVPHTAWPKPPSGPPPISNPVKASEKITHRLSNTMSAPPRPTSPTKVLMLGDDSGENRGVPNSTLLIKYAADKQQGELTILLKQGEDPNVKAAVPWQQFETTPLFEACVNGYARIVRILIEHGAKLDEIVGPGYTCVYNAALNGHGKVVSMLIDAGADPGINTEAGMSPLYAAAQGGHGDCLVDILGSPLMTKALMNYAGNGNGATALTVAAQNGHFACVRELIQAGVEVNPKLSTCGSTPLHVAIFIAQRDNDKPHRNITEILLHNGADVHAKNNEGLTAIDLAKDDNSLIRLVEDEKEARSKGGFWR